MCEAGQKGQRSVSEDDAKLTAHSRELTHTFESTIMLYCNTTDTGSIYRRQHQRSVSEDDATLTAAGQLACSRRGCDTIVQFKP